MKVCGLEVYVGAGVWSSGVCWYITVDIPQALALGTTFKVTASFLSNSSICGLLRPLVLEPLIC